jgi:hypothetical protein
MSYNDTCCRMKDEEIAALKHDIERHVAICARQADQIEQIRKALLPDDEVRDDNVSVSSEPYYNLEGVLHDLRRQNADPVCIRTIERVQEQIALAQLWLSPVNDGQNKV